MIRKEEEKKERRIIIYYLIHRDVMVKRMITVYVARNGLLLWTVANTY